jgi:predicted AlkP superfamily phosphohydrolase/phosphomutase
MREAKHLRARSLFPLVLAALCLWVTFSGGPHSSAINGAYIGPGAGFAFIGSFLTLVIAFAASVLSLLLWPFRLLWLAVRRKGRFGNTQIKKAIFLGLDGLDPKLTERWMAEGKLPNLSRLREQGSYHRLRTTFPALSPVAWSTFATGVNPARHNIFDFLNRDLRTYAPELSSAKVRRSERTLNFGLFRYVFSRSSVELRRKSEPFWKILGRNAIGSTILRVPITFPPERFSGRLLSAMSTPDLLGTQGSFCWFSNRNDSQPSEGGVRILFTRRGDRLEGMLPGPDGMAVPFTLFPGERAADRILHIQGTALKLCVGEYSPWVRLRFKKGMFSSARGICRFLLTEADANVSLYVTPVQIDPENPALPISQPGYYAAYLAKLLGTFATLGMAEDTWALNEGAIDEEAFLKQAKLIQAEREAMFFSALEHTRRGVVACVFDTTDRVQHMFYRHLEGESAHPDPRYASVIEDLYRDMDRVVGRTLAYADKHTGVFVLSDHGFCSFRRGVNLNSWLHQHGYLVLRNGLQESGEFLEGVDWSRTRAYTFGLSGLYLNLRGREAEGVVRAEAAAALRTELIARLTGLQDTEAKAEAILQVYDSHSIYRGPYLDAAPDLVVGYAPGYRASWSAAKGQVTGSVFEENSKRWSGDHCVDPNLVPGVLFSNMRVEASNPGIEDLAPTVLHLFGVTPPSWMEGQILGTSF